MSNEKLAFGLHYDRDHFVAFAKTFREIFWPISLFLVHPFTIFVLIRKSPMRLDCKTAYIVLMCFDFYNCFLYQMYPLAPLPVFICTGSLCHGTAEGTTMLKTLSHSDWPFVLDDIVVCPIPLHNAENASENAFSRESIQIANVFGFHYWAVEPPNKKELLKMKEIVWAEKFTSNFLVLGQKEGDVGTFIYELALLVVSIFVNFSFYVFITYHAVYKIGKQLGKGSSKTREAQLRFVYSLSIQACCSAVLFILPLLLLFLGLVIFRVPFFPGWLLPGWFIAPFRVVMLLAYTSCSIAHSIVYLSKNPWFIQQTRRVLGMTSNTPTISAVASHFKWLNSIMDSTGIATTLFDLLQCGQAYYLSFNSLHIIRQIYWPITIFIFHPLVIFIIFVKSSMTADCKLGYVGHTIVLIGFDFYNGFLYQMYTLAPYPIIICTGYLCNEDFKPGDLLNLLAVFTVSICVPYLFLMIRMHQRILFTDSPLKASMSTQMIVLLVLTTILFSNIFGFHYWYSHNAPYEPANIYLQRIEIAWAKNLTSNFLVLGTSIGDIGPFSNELALLLISILINFSSYVFITYHAIYEIGKQLSRKSKTKVHGAQLRFVYSQSIQATASGILFISPFILLFVGFYRESWGVPGVLMAFGRFSFLVLNYMEAMLKILDDVLVHFNRSFRYFLDRDYFVNISRIVRHIYWPISVILINPFLIFVLHKRTQMSTDCKTAYIAHHIILLCFDFYNGFLYQMYPLAPLPIFFCFGVLCTEGVSSRVLLTALAFWTIAMCVPYLFIMMRMHQKMLFHGSPFKMSIRSQSVIMISLTATLLANLIGFAYFTTESNDKQEILSRPSVEWVKSNSVNFLVLGGKVGEVGNFIYELCLLAVSIIINYAFYISITYHAVYKIGRQMSNRRSKTHDIQLRFIYSLTIQAILTAIFFITPLILLFVGLVIDLTPIVPDGLFAFSRFLFLMMFSTCSFSHSAVFLSKNPWFIQQVKRRILRSKNSSKSTTVVTTVAFDVSSRARSIIPGSSSYGATKFCRE
uniref:G protein-coupled receptor n=1 Tax=Pristionchus pacificus TaxID=54126 RepID=A0A8R1U6S9_PRIPA